MRPWRWLTRTRREACFARADELLELCRPLDNLPANAHARIKRRLEAESARRAATVPRWVRPVVAGTAMLVCGVAFGIAIDRLALKRQPAISPKEPALHSGKSLGRTPSSTRPRKEVQESAAPPNADRNATEMIPTTLPGPSAPTAPHAAVLRAGRIPSPGIELRAPPRGLSMRDPAPPVQQPAPTLTIPSASPAPPSLSPESFVPQAPPLGDSATLPKTSSVQIVDSPQIAAPAAKRVPEAAPTLSEERLLAAAVHSLRSQKDPRSALSALDDYRIRYPHGRLAAEASILRVDAAVALDRRADALATLESLDLSRVPGSIERQLQRGELCAWAGRWREAWADFDRVLSHSSDRDSLLERALWGRAQAGQRLGHRDEMRRDATDYLRRFPRGRFAAQAGLLLEADAR